jgi:phage baseplate assembly protein W
VNTAKHNANKHLLTDLAIEVLHHELRPVYRVANEQRRNPPGNAVSRFVDFVTLTGNDNLAQAIKIRLLTPRGELTALGHPDYGSRLHELIGQPNTDTKRNLVRLYIIEALKREPRIAEITELEVKPVSGTRDQLSVLLEVQPVASSELVNVEGINLIL